jgi:hypothetical protein
MENIKALLVILLFALACAALTWWALRRTNSKTKKSTRRPIAMQDASISNIPWDKPEWQRNVKASPRTEQEFRNLFFNNANICTVCGGDLQMIDGEIQCRDLYTKHTITRLDGRE